MMKIESFLRGTVTVDNHIIVCEKIGFFEKRRLVKEAQPFVDTYEYVYEKEALMRAMNTPMYNAVLFDKLEIGESMILEEVQVTRLSYRIYTGVYVQELILMHNNKIIEEWFDMRTTKNVQSNDENNLFN